MFQECFKLGLLWYHHLCGCHLFIWWNHPVSQVWLLHFLHNFIHACLQHDLPGTNLNWTPTLVVESFWMAQRFHPATIAVSCQEFVSYFFCPQVPPFFHSVTSIEDGGMIKHLSFRTPPGVLSRLRLRSQWQCFEYGGGFGTRSLWWRMVLNWVR